MGEKVYFHKESVEATVDQFLADYRSKSVENMAIIWTTKDDGRFAYNFIATESCYKLLGLLDLLHRRVLDYIDHFLRQQKEWTNR